MKERNLFTFSGKIQHSPGAPGQAARPWFPSRSQNPGSNVCQGSGCQEGVEAPERAVDGEDHALEDSVREGG